MTATFEIGTEFLSSGKHPHHCTVDEVFKTYNSKGELCRVTYLVSHQFVGQRVSEHDVCAVTIARGVDRLKYTAAAKSKNPA